MAGGIFTGATPVQEVIHGLPDAPTITISPIDPALVEPGVVISFTATFTGYGVLSLQWNLDGVAISGATAATYDRTTVAGDDGGVITCTVSNPHSQSVTSAGSTMTVELWTPAKLFRDGRKGGWYEIRPGNVWKDTAMNLPAVEGDNIFAIGDLSGNGEHIKKGGTVVIPTLQRDANGYFLAYPTYNLNPHAEFEWTDPVSDTLDVPMSVAFFFSKGTNPNSGVKQTMYSVRYTNTTPSTIQALSIAVGQATGTAYDLQAKSNGASLANHPVAITAGDLDCYLSTMYQDGTGVRADQRRDGSPDVLQTGTATISAAILPRSKIIGSFHYGAKLRAMLDTPHYNLTNDEWAKLNTYFRAMPK